MGIPNGRLRRMWELETAADQLVAA
jgi:hypothetical protein